jgi:plasmid stabilization system protein ParE
MGYQIVWTPKAIAGFDEVVDYLKIHWTDRELTNFIDQTNAFLRLLQTHPRLLQKTSKYKNVHRGPLNKLTIVTYRVKERKRQIEIINIQDARRKPN